MPTSQAEKVTELREAAKRLLEETKRLQRNLERVHQLQAALADTLQHWVGNEEKGLSVK